jgi:hypothetical protein
MRIAFNGVDSEPYLFIPAPDEVPCGIRSGALRSFLNEHATAHRRFATFIRARVELSTFYLERGSRHYLRGDSTKSGERALAAILLIILIMAMNVIALFSRPVHFRRL